MPTWLASRAGSPRPRRGRDRPRGAHGAGRSIPCRRRARWASGAESGVVGARMLEILEPADIAPILADGKSGDLFISGEHSLEEDGHVEWSSRLDELEHRRLHHIDTGIDEP